MRGGMNRRVIARLWFIGVMAATSAGGVCAATPRLFVDCRGDATSAPTVILEAGAFGTSADWDFVLKDLSAGGRVCAYDRAGLGRSPGADQPKDVVARAEQLRDTLDQMGETAPLILVGHSNGAAYVEAFAKLFAPRVAGLVYVNGVTSDDLDQALLVNDLRKEKRLSELAARAEHLGLAPIIAPLLVAQIGLTGDAAHFKYRSLTCQVCVTVARDEDRLLEPGLEAVRRLETDIRHIPVAVVVGDTDPKSALAQAFRIAETAPAARADHAWILDAPGATHVSPLSRDRAYIAAAVNWLRATYRPLPDPDIGH
jgi:pimeloyl-ACP methyl ester carboxylesterase